MQTRRSAPCGRWIGSEAAGQVAEMSRKPVFEGIRIQGVGERGYEREGETERGFNKG